MFVFSLIKDIDVNPFTDAMPEALKDNNDKKFQHLLFVVRGSCGFKKYETHLECNDCMKCIKELFPRNNLGQYFRNISMAKIEEAYEKVLPESLVDFNECNDKFKTGLAETLNKKLFNADQMSIKTHANSDQSVKVEDLFLKFRYFVNKLNGDQIPMDIDVTIFKQEHTSDGDAPEPIESESLESYDTIEDMKDILANTTTKEIRAITQATQLLETDLDSDLKNQDANSSSVKENEQRSSSIAINDQQIQNCSTNQNKITVSEETVIDIDNSVNQTQSCSSVGQNKCENSSRNDSTNSEQRIDSNQGESNTKDIDKDSQIKAKDDGLQESENNYQKITEEFLIEIRPRIEKWFQFHEIDLSEEIKLKLPRTNTLLNALSAKLKNCDQNTLQKMKAQVNDKISEIIDYMNSHRNILLSELSPKYNNLIDECVGQYKSNLIARLKFKSRVIDTDFRSVHKESAISATNFFGSEVSKFNEYNNHLLTEAKSNLKTRLDNGLKSLDIIVKYVEEWRVLYEKDYLFTGKLLSEKHNDIKQYVLGLLNESEFKPLMESIIQRVFADISTTNAELIESEKNLNQEIIGITVEKVMKCFECQLKSGSYDERQAEQMFGKLICHAIKLLKEVVEYSEETETNVEDVSALKSSAEYNKICSQYFRTNIELKSVCDRASRDAIRYYTEEMSNMINRNHSVDLNLMIEYSDRIIFEAMNMNLQRLEAFKDYYSEEYFNAKILINFNDKTMIEINKTRNQIMQKWEQKKQKQEVSSTSKTHSEESTTDSISLVLSVYFSHQTLFGSVFDDNISNKFEMISPNKIAITDEIIVGDDAREHLDQNIGIFKEFDIKNLLNVKYKEDKASDIYPFEYKYLDGHIRANVKDKFVLIESLIALQVLDIKSKAEKQLSTDIEKAVFVVPNHYNVLLREKFQELSVFAGFMQSVEVMYEITCAAIGYCNYHQIYNRINVLFVAINDLKCDAAVVRLDQRAVIYEDYFYRELDVYDKNIMEKLFGSSDPEVGKKVEKSIEQMVKYMFEKSKRYNIRDIADVVVIGSSTYMDFIIKRISDNMKKIEVTIDESGRYVSRGAAIYAKYAMEHKKKFSYHVEEVAFHTLFCKMTMNKFLTTYSYPIVKRGYCLPHRYFSKFQQPIIQNLPIFVKIYQDEDQPLQKYEINKLSEFYLRKRCFYSWRHGIEIKINELGKIKFDSTMTLKDLYGTDRFYSNEFSKISLTGSSKDLEIDKQFINSLRIQKQRAEEENRIKEQIDGKTQELQCLCQHIRQRLRNKFDMTRMKRKCIETSLDKVDKCLSNGIEVINDFNVIERQIKELEKMID